MLLDVIDCPDWNAGRCSRPESVALYGERPSTGTCTLAVACGRGRATGETLDLPDPSADLSPVPPAEWPTWARWIATRRKDADAGVGDTVERLLGVGGEAFKALWDATVGHLGIDCGCAARRAAWNAQYPYEHA